MTTSGVALLALVLILTEPAASQVYQQATYGQGVYAQYPKPMIVPQAAQSDITVFIIPFLLVVLVAVIVPALVGSSWIVMKEMKTTKHPTTMTTTTRMTTSPTTTTPLSPGG